MQGNDLRNSHALTAPNKIYNGATFLQLLRAARREGLKQLFYMLPPPQASTFCGEYDAELLDQGSWFWNYFTKRVFQSKGEWLGKAFHPLSCDRGVGYNMFRSSGNVVRELPMDTTIAKSTLDGRLSLHINYGEKNQGVITKLSGEVRQITLDVLLGFGMFTASFGGRVIGQRKIPFLLLGPRRPYQVQHRDECSSDVAGCL